MLAMVLMDQRLVVVVAPVLDLVVEVIDGAERLAQTIDLRLAHAIEILALARLALAVGVALRAGCDLELRDVGNLQALDLAAPRLQRAEIDGLDAIILGEPVIDPVRDELDIRVGDARAAPGQRRKAACRRTAQRRAIP
jgi:hypothetical protein